MKTKFIFLIAILIAHPLFSQDQKVFKNPPEKNTDSMIIDINLDGTPDFILKHTQNTGSFFCSRDVTFTDHAITFQPLNGTQYTRSPLQFGSSINENSDWSSVPSYLAWTQHNMLKSCKVKRHIRGEWFLVPDKYLGLKVQVEGKSFYGWIRIEVAKDATNIKLYDFAFCAKPYQNIACSVIYSSGLVLPFAQIPETENEVTMRSVQKARD